MNVRISPRRFLPALVLGLLFLLDAPPCRAGLLPINFQPGAPTVSGSNGSIGYNASTEDFKATLATLPGTLTLNATFIKTLFTVVRNPNLVIDLQVDTNGNFVANPNNSVALSGTVSFTDQFGGTVSFGGMNNPLLSGTITAFGDQQTGPSSVTFSGIFNITGGALTQTVIDSKGNAIFGGYTLGLAGGFNLAAEGATSGKLGDFTSSFSSGSVKPTLGVLVPEPSTLALVLTGVVVLGWRRKIRLLPCPLALELRRNTLARLLPRTVVLAVLRLTRRVPPRARTVLT